MLIGVIANFEPPRDEIFPLTDSSSAFVLPDRAVEFYRTGAFSDVAKAEFENDIRSGKVKLPHDQKISLHRDSNGLFMAYIFSLAFFPIAFVVDVFQYLVLGFFNPVRLFTTRSASIFPPA